ncbi:MAG: reverse gyrase [Thermoproteus sp.]
MDFKALPAVYLHSCPNCGGAIESRRLARGLPCSECLPLEVGEADLRRVIEELKRRRALDGLSRLEEKLKRYEEINALFEKIVGFGMWGAQRLWARRLAAGKSFAVVAPTGSGKTTFLLVASLYMAGRGKALLVFPTSALAYQAYRKLLDYSQRAGLNVKIVTYNTMLRPQEREEALNRIKSGDFDVLVITSAFLPKYFDLLSRYKFAFIATDDVDSVLRATSKNIERILRLLGVNDEVLNKALELIELGRKRGKALLGGDEKAVEETEREMTKLREELRKLTTKLELGVFVASGALAKARRTTRLLLFREILGFDVGGRAEGLRNVYDLYVKLSEDPKAQVAELVRRLGGGGIIYVSDREFGRELVQHLQESGIKAEHFFRPRRKALEAFEQGQLEVLVGLASSRSALVRGIDLPHVIRYVIFVGIPKYKFRVRLDEFSVPAYLSFLYNVRAIVPQELKFKVDRLIAQLRRIAPYSARLDKILKEGASNSFEEYVLNVAKSAVELVDSLLKDERIKKAIEASTEVKLTYIDGQLYVLLPDVTTYIQGSGRTSRLYAGGLSRGLSVILVDDEKVLNALRRELELRFDEVRFEELSKADLDKILKEVDEDRRTIRRIMSGQLRPEELSARDLMRSILLVVESPTKARTIASFFGRPNMLIIGGMPAYEVSTGDSMLTVIATMGHIFELPTNLKRIEEGEGKKVWRLIKPVEAGPYSPMDYAVVKTEEGYVPIYNKIYKCPSGSYVDDLDLPPECRPLDIVSTLRELASEVDLVYLGTDPDSEGEKIAYDVYLILRPYVGAIKRIEFHEVTRRAIAAALSSPRDVNLSMVAAQTVRRIEDRWLGFGLSRKVQEAHGLSFLSAGRVQTPVLGWIVERYESSKAERKFDVVLRIGEGQVRLALPEETYKKLKERGTVSISLLEAKRETIQPPPPYTTDEYMRDAVNKLGISAEEAMRIAQDLFESGFITYHRTDSTRVSATGIGIAKEYISKRYGADSFKPRVWAAGEEGAHEAIRPTRPIDAEELRGLVAAGVIQPAIRLTRNHYAAYDLIFRRFMASQMREAEVTTERYSISIDGANFEVRRVVEVNSAGFLAEYKSVEVEPRLPTGEVEAEVVYAKRLVELLSQADVLRMMRERGIGRPSTYAKILEVLSRRGYVVVRGRRKFMIPTKRGIEVYKYLKENYGKLVSEERTRLIEKYMDDVENGRKNYAEVLDELFTEFIQEVLERQ